MITVAENRKRNHGFYIAARPNRILNIQKAKREFEQSVFSEKDLRGLSNYEKKFLREHDMKKCYDCFYLFIEKNKSTGKKQLYAFHKLQVFFPSGHDLSAERYNNQIWLTFDRRYYTGNTYYEPFSKWNYEFRFTDNAYIEHKASLYFN